MKSNFTNNLRKANSWWKLVYLEVQNIPNAMVELKIGANKAFSLW